MLILVLLFVWVTYSAKSIEETCYQERECKGDTRGQVNKFVEGECTKTQQGSAIVSCTSTGGIKLVEYNDGNCKDKGATVTGGSCLANGDEGSCKFKGCTNTLAIVITVLVIVIVLFCCVCCCCIIFVVVIAVAVLALGIYMRGRNMEEKEDEVYN